jgi:zinc protease
MSSDIESSYLSIVFAGPELRSMETFALDVLMEALGGCRSARLNARIFEELALVTEIDAYNRSYMDAGKLAVEAELKDSSNIQPVIDETFRIISEVTSTGLTDKEIERAKRCLAAERLFSSERIFGIGELYGQDVLLCDIDFADKYAERILSVTPDQILNVARKYLRPENMVLGVNYPEADGELEFSVEQLKPYEPGIEKPEVPYGVIISDFTVPPIRSGKPGIITREVLPNGVVWLHQHNPITPTVSIQVFIRGGLAYESRGNNGIGEMTHRALWKGTREMSAKEFSIAIDSLGAKLETDCDRDFFSIQSSFLSRDLETGFRLISDLTLHPSFPESEFEKIRDEVLGIIAQVMDDTDEVSLLKLLAEIFELDHPYGRPTCGTVEAVGSLTNDDVREFHRLITAPGNIVVSVVGDVDADEAGKLVEKYFGEPASSDNPLPDINPPAGPSGLKTVVEYRDKSQVRISMGRPGPSLSHPDFPKAKMMSTILGATSYSRLFMNLRDEMGLAYDVYTTLQRGRSPALFLAYIGTSPDTCTDAIEAIRLEYRRLIDEGPTAEEIRNARSWLRGNTLIYHQGNHAIAESFGANEAVGMPYDFDFRLLEEYEKVTDSDVISAAEKYADPDNMVISLCGPVEDDTPVDVG